MTTTNSNLETTLNDFQNTFNENTRVKKLIKGWDRSIMLEATDTDSKFSLLISDLKLSEVKEGLVELDPTIHLQAEESILMRIFSGDYNPASALMDGALAVFSGEKDKVKLEALSMIIWRLS